MKGKKNDPPWRQYHVTLIPDILEATDHRRSTDAFFALKVVLKDGQQYGVYYEAQDVPSVLRKAADNWEKLMSDWDGIDAKAEADQCQPS